MSDHRSGHCTIHQLRDFRVRGEYFKKTRQFGARGVASARFRPNQLAHQFIERRQFFTIYREHAALVDGQPL